MVFYKREVKNEPAVFQQNQRDDVRIIEGAAGAINASSGMHCTNFMFQPEPGHESAKRERSDMGHTMSHTVSDRCIPPDGGD